MVPHLQAIVVPWPGSHLVQPDIHAQTHREFQILMAWQPCDVLEIGCGDGRLSGLLASLGCRLVAVDPDEAMLNVARETHPGVDFRCASGERLPFGEAAFDVVVFTLSLHHQNPQEALQEALRVLRPGGRIIVLEPTGASELEQLCRLFVDETDAQARALLAISQARLHRISDHTFRTEWCFVDSEELINGLFAYFGQAREENKTRSIQAVLGDRMTARPLSLWDELRLITLQRA